MSPPFDTAPSAVAFDLDGTLVDSAPDIHAALNSALALEGFRRASLDEVRGWVGDGPDVLIARALEAQGAPLDDARPHDRALALRLRRGFDVATLTAPLVAGHVFAGIAEQLARLARALPLVVVTNKPTPLARAVLAAAEILPRFAAVYGADTPDLRKPAPAMLLAAAGALGIAPQRLAMVGDSAADMRCAEAAGCTALLVGWGYGAHAVSAPVRRIDTPADLHDALLGAQAAARQESIHAP